MSKKSQSFSKQLCLSNISVISLPDNFLSFPKHTVFPSNCIPFTYLLKFLHRAYHCEKNCAVQNQYKQHKTPQNQPAVTVTKAESLSTGLLLVKSNAMCVEMMPSQVQFSSSLQTPVLEYVILQYVICIHMFMYTF